MNFHQYKNSRYSIKQLNQPKKHKYTISKLTKINFRIKSSEIIDEVWLLGRKLVHHRVLKY